MAKNWCKKRVQGIFTRFWVKTSAVFNWFFMATVKTALFFNWSHLDRFFTNPSVLYHSWKSSKIPGPRFCACHVPHAPSRQLLCMQLWVLQGSICQHTTTKDVKGRCLHVACPHLLFVHGFTHAATILAPASRSKRSIWQFDQLSEFHETNFISVFGVPGPFQQGSSHDITWEIVDLLPTFTVQTLVHWLRDGPLRVRPVVFVRCDDFVSVVLHLQRTNRTWRCPRIKQSKPEKSIKPQQIWKLRMKENTMINQNILIKLTIYLSRFG